MFFYLQSKHSYFLGYEHILVERKGEKQNVALITLNRPKAFNALCDGLMKEVSNALDSMENDSGIGAIVITGSERAFAAGNFLIRHFFYLPI